MPLQQWLHRVKNGGNTPPVYDAWQAETHRALHDLHTAENYFNSVAEPELVEYAAYELEAARRKYEYLLRCLRKRCPPQE